MKLGFMVSLMMVGAVAHAGTFVDVKTKYPSGSVSPGLPGTTFVSWRDTNSGQRCDLMVSGEFTSADLNTGKVKLTRENILAFQCHDSAAYELQSQQLKEVIDLLKNQSGK